MNYRFNKIKHYQSELIYLKGVNMYETRHTFAIIDEVL